MVDGSKVKAIVKPNYLSVVLGKKKFQLTKAHPHFERIKTALEEKRYSDIPQLVNLAEKLSVVSNGNIVIEKDVVKYKGEALHTSLSNRILKIHEEGHDVTHMILFLENLYQNPDKHAREELYDFLHRCNLPPTDDGCFVAYKAVRQDYKDCHTGSIDNSPGQVVMMARRAVDPNRANECSNGLHFASLSYLRNFRGDKVMMVKINPADVVSIPRDYNYSKGRCCKYEVIMELGRKSPEIEKDGHIILESAPVVEIQKERKQLLKELLAHPVVKRNIQKKKLSESTLKKAAFARLKVIAEKYKLQTGKKTEPVVKRLFINPLGEMRKAAGITRETLANELDITVKTLVKHETTENPSKEVVDNFTAAVQMLGGMENEQLGGVSFPKPSGLFDALNLSTSK